MNKFLRFVKDESGATAIEYGLIAAAMGLALVTAMPILASAVTGKFSSLSRGGRCRCAMGARPRRWSFRRERSIAARSGRETSYV